jgi:hypothetical protein
MERRKAKGERRNPDLLPYPFSFILSVKGRGGIPAPICGDEIGGPPLR